MKLLAHYANVDRKVRGSTQYHIMQSFYKSQINSVILFFIIKVTIYYYKSYQHYNAKYTDTHIKFIITALTSQAPKHKNKR